MFLHRLASVVRWIFNRNRAEADLDDELQTFVDMAAADKVRDGATPAEARRLAVLQVGGVEQLKERVRTGRHGAWLDAPDGICGMGAAGPTRSGVLGDRDRNARARHRRDYRDVQRLRRGADPPALRRCGPSRDDLGRDGKTDVTDEAQLHARRMD